MAVGGKSLNQNLYTHTNRKEKNQRPENIMLPSLKLNSKLKLLKCEKGEREKKESEVSPLPCTILRFNQ